MTRCKHLSHIDHIKLSITQLRSLKFCIALEFAYNTSQRSQLNKDNTKPLDEGGRYGSHVMHSNPQQQIWQYNLRQAQWHC